MMRTASVTSRRMLVVVVLVFVVDDDDDEHQIGFVRNGNILRMIELE